VFFTVWWLSGLQLCEVDLRKLLPESAFSPFADELRNREKRRNRVRQEVRITSFPLILARTDM
jgi:hypothetical protein